jgi:hypothetical protein
VYDASDRQHVLEQAGVWRRSTTNCQSTWTHDRDSSRLVTTCTSY